MNVQVKFVFTLSNFVFFFQDKLQDNFKICKIGLKDIFILIILKDVFINLYILIMFVKLV